MSEEAQIRHLAEQRFTDPEIGERLGLSANQVRWRRRRYGIKSAGLRYIEEKKEKAVKPVDLTGFKWGQKNLSDDNIVKLYQGRRYSRGKTIGEFQHVPHDKIGAFERAGWVVCDDLRDTHHGNHAVRMKRGGV